MALLRLALDQETFAFHGRHFELPPPGLPDRGGTVAHLTLVPRPLHPYEVWQPVTSPPTLDYVPAAGHHAVFWNQHHTLIARQWDRYAELWEQAHGELLEPGARRMLVVTVRIEDDEAKARESARAGHDEFWKFLGPYGWSRGYLDEDGRPVPAGLIPTLEQSLAQRTWLVGSPRQVAEGVAAYREQLGLEYLTIFPHLPGDTYKKAEEQMSRFMEEVVPLLA
jgi:alkanesulfonate monooxygenase SsuD/methylene tetrahydromethanopterin reductase-like flavin-dependent oxidoreductase (luciferase family)